MYGKTCVKRPLAKRRDIDFHDQLSLNADQKYCRMLQEEHSAILSTFIKLPFVIKIFVLSTFEWSFYTGFTVSGLKCFCHGICYLILIQLKEVHTLWVVSSGSPPLMRIPLVAPTPVPTITAVGVARPKAQGQAILRTVIAYWKAFWNTISATVVSPPSCSYNIK